MAKIFILKRCFGLTVGICLAAGFYFGILIDLGFEPSVLRILGISLYCLLGLGCFFSEELQCVGMICVTMFCSRVGRRTLQGMIFAYLIAGPGQNIIYNGQEVARSFGCTAELAYNLSKEYTFLVTAPFKHAIMGMKEDDAASVSGALKQMNKQISPLKKELQGDVQQEKQLEEESDYVDRVQGNSLRSRETEGRYTVKNSDSEGEEIEKKYMKNLELKCQGILSRSTERCRDGFSSAYQSCEDKVSIYVSWLVCWPMKLTFVCDIITLVAGDRVCDAAENVDPGYGESFSSLSHADQIMSREMGRTRFHYKVPRPDVTLDLKDASASVRNVMADVQVKMDAAQTLLLIMRRLLALLFLPVILESVKYVNLYLVKPDHDNRYITAQFNRMDLRRAHAGRQPTLLPLRHEEMSNLVNTFSPFPNGPERKNIFGPYLKLSMLCLLAGVVLSTDYMLGHTLELVAKHSRTNITQTGHHAVHITVKGSGFVGKMVRSMVQGFNEDAKIHNVFTNEACLPRARKLDHYYLGKIFLTFLAMAAMVVLDHLPVRLRTFICSRFYPKREKQRTLHLYNELLKSRCNWRSSMQDKLRDKAEQLRQKEAMKLPMPGPLRWLLDKMPKYRGKRRCVMCLAKESKTRDSVSCHECPPGLDYCPGCWGDLQEACLACAPPVMT